MVDTTLFRCYFKELWIVEPTPEEIEVFRPGDILTIQTQQVFDFLLEQFDQGELSIDPHDIIFDIVKIIEDSLPNSLLFFDIIRRSGMIGSFNYHVKPDDPDLNPQLEKTVFRDIPTLSTLTDVPRDTWTTLMANASEDPVQATMIAVFILKSEFPKASNRALADLIISINPFFKSRSGVAGQLSIFSKKGRSITITRAQMWVRNVQLLVGQKGEFELTIMGVFDS